jgi:hypothetical protein
MPDAEDLIKHFVSILTCILYHSSAICVALLLQNKHKWLGVLIMLLDIPIYYLTKAKE